VLLNPPGVVVAVVVVVAVAVAAAADLAVDSEDFGLMELVVAAAVAS